MLSKTIVSDVATQCARPLFSHTNSSGSFHSAAMFMVSWKVPRVTAPSPKQTTAMRPSPRTLADSAAPAAMAWPAPTMPLAPSMPCPKSAMCSEPPLPRQ